MKRVLVTGATGFIGRHSLGPLAASGYEVHAVSSRVPPGPSAGVRWHRADLLDPARTAALVDDVRPTHLLHFAWCTAPGDYRTSPRNVSWLRASLGLLEAFTRHGGRRAVAAGTCAEYDWRYGYCSERLTQTAPATLYGACKHSLRVVLDALAARGDLDAAWGRIFFLYGPHERPDRLVSSVILSLLAGETARCSHGDLIRDFLHVEDVAGAFVALLESDVRGAVNVASGIPIAVGDVARAAADKIGRRDLLEVGIPPAAPEEPPLVVADVSRLTREVGWRPRYTLDSGLDQTILWWRSRLADRENRTAG